jgi:hypothetical protein
MFIKLTEVHGVEELGITINSDQIVWYDRANGDELMSRIKMMDGKLVWVKECNSELDYMLGTKRFLDGLDYNKNNQEQQNDVVGD